MKYFTLDELCASRTAEQLGIVNRPDEATEERLIYLAENLLDPLRAAWGAPLLVTSGYRCAALNAVVGGARNSQHMKGEAVDITAGSATMNRRLIELIRTRFTFDQLIDENRGAWVHVSLKEYGNRNAFLTID